MKKHLLLFLGLTLIACSSNDEDDEDARRTIDPIIVTWTSEPYDTLEFDDVTDTIVFNSNSTWVNNSTIG